MVPTFSTESSGRRAAARRPVRAHLVTGAPAIRLYRSDQTIIGAMTTSQPMSVPLAVLRLPNPKGDIANFAEAFGALFGAFGLAAEFSIDDAVEVLIERRMLSSSGAVGDEALRRSTRDDRSRDPLFNQFKMFSELYRLLGWLHVWDARSRFVCTQLGRYVAEYRHHGRNRLTEESMIGIALPNPHSENFGVTNARPFATLLKTMRALDGMLSRDELIVSVYTLSDDLDQTAVAQRLGLMTSARREGRYDVVSKLLEQAAGARQVNTLHNYTRFMIGAMRRLGWTKCRALGHRQRRGPPEQPRSARGGDGPRPPVVRAPGRRGVRGTAVVTGRR